MSSGNRPPEGPKAILNDDERKMLRGEDIEDLTDAARYQRYSRIRKRLRWAIYDFALIYDNWDEINLDKAFEEREPHWYMMDGVTRAISTFYRGMADEQLSFKSALIDGIWRAESDMNNRRVDIRFDVEPEVTQNVYVNDAIERVTPEDVDSMRIPEMRAVLEGLANSDLDIPELLKEDRNKPLDETEDE